MISPRAGGGIFYREQGWLKHSILLTNTPSAVIAEGIAGIALEMIAGGDEIPDIYQSILEQAGLDKAIGKLLFEVRKARQPLGKVAINRVLMLHRDGAPAGAERKVA